MAMTVMNSLPTLTPPPEQHSPELLEMDSLLPVVSPGLNGPPRSPVDEPLGKLWELTIEANVYVVTSDVTQELLRSSQLLLPVALSSGPSGPRSPSRRPARQPMMMKGTPMAFRSPWFVMSVRALNPFGILRGLGARASLLNDLFVLLLLRVLSQR